MSVEIWTKPDLKDYWSILPTEGRRKPLGWVRRQTNVPGKPYMVKIYGARFEAQGSIKGVETDCRIFEKFSDAVSFIHNHFERS